MSSSIDLVSGNTAPFSTSHTSNWVARRGGLPKRVRAIARAVKRKHPEWTLSHCIAVAINAVKYSAATGDSKLPGRQDEKPSTVAAHQVAAAKWAAMKDHRTHHHADDSDAIELTGDGHGHHVPGTPFVYRHGWKPIDTGAKHADERNRQDSGAAPTVRSGEVSHGKTERQWQARIGKLERWKANTDPTDVTYTDKNGDWTPERSRLHAQIVEDLYARSSKVPNEGKAVFSGGLGGAGKSTVLKQAGLSEDNYLTLNPDDIKEELVKRGMAPKPPAGVSPMEAAPLVHEESSYLAKQLAKRAAADRKNVVWDITMKSPDSVRSRLDNLSRAGYDEPVGVFVDIPVEASVKRAMSRYERGVQSYEHGTGLGGRYVPPDEIRGSKDATHGSKNRRTFETLKDRFASWQLWDNSGDKPHRVTAKGART